MRAQDADIAFLVGVVLLAGAAVLPWFPTTIGDGYIVARYAENLVEHGELVFNLGERIWAFTSATHVLFEALLYAMTGQTLAANKVGGLVAVGFGSAMVASLARQREEKALILVALCLNPFLLYWALHGLETAYLFAGVAWLTWQVRQPPLDGSWRMVALGLTAGLLLLTRYDAVLLAAPIVLHAVIQRRRPWIDGMLLAPGAVLVLAWMGWAGLYYGDVVPASFHHKTPSLGPEAWIGLGYVATFLLFSGVGFTEAWPWGDGWRSRLEKTWRSHGGLIVAVGSFLPYGVLAGTKHMMFGYRLLLPLMPILWALVLQLRHAGDAPPPPPRPPRAVGPVVLLLGTQVSLYAAMWLVAVDLSPVPTEYGGRSISKMNQSFAEIYEPIAQRIDAHWDEQGVPGVQPRLATFEAGLVPYRLPWIQVVDQGLITPHQGCSVDRIAVSHYAMLNGLPEEDVVGTTLRQYPGLTHLGTFGHPETAGYTVSLFFQPDPMPYLLPSRIREPCRTPG